MMPARVKPFSINDEAVERIGRNLTRQVCFDFPISNFGFFHY